MFRKPTRSRLVFVFAFVAITAALSLLRFGSEAQRRPNAPLATVTATLDDGVTPNTTRKNPGDTINYTAVLSDSVSDATVVVYNSTLDPNTTLIGGSIHASPIAANESYTTVGNTLLEAGVAATGNPAVTSAVKLFDNDSIAPIGTDAIQLVSFSAASSNGGTVSVNANGSFTYLPPAGFTGTDTFTYIIRNSNAASLTDTATVTITVGAPRVWYVNNSGVNGDGRSNSPFNTLANAAAVDAAGDIIYVFTGSGNYTGGITLLNNEQVIGNGVALVVNTFTLRGAGSRPTVVNAGGAGITLGQNDTLSGFNFGASTGFSITGTSVGTLAVNNMLINNTSGGALDLTGVGTPTVNVVLDGTTSTGGTKNVNLVGLNGTVTLGSGALSGASNNAFDVSGGAATISYTGTVTNTAAARLVNVASMTGGSLSLSGALSGTGSSTGVNLTSNAGATLNFTGGIALSTAGNAAFTAIGGGPAATTGGTINVTQNNTTIVNTLATTTGIALNVANITIGASGLTFRSISSNGAGNGIVVNNTGTTGSFVISGNGGACTSAGTCTGGAIQNSTGDGAVLTSTQSPSLTRLNVTDSAGGAADDGIVLTNIPGTVTIDNSSIINSPHNGITVDNNTNMAGFNLTNTTISCASGQPCQPSGSIGNDGLSMTIRGTSVLTFGLVSGSTFSGHRGVGVQVQANDSGRIGSNSGGVITAPAASNSITVQGNAITGSGQGIDIDEAQIANISFQVLTNTVVGKLTAPGAISSQASAVAINAFTGAGAGTGPTVHTFVGKIDGNIIGTQGVKDSGAGFGSGIRGVIQGSATQGVVSITNNTIRETPNADIITAIGQNGAAASPSATARFKITGNSMPAPTGSNLGLCGPLNTACASNGIFILADEGSPVCNAITGNTVYDLSTMNGTAGVYLAERAGPPAGSALTVEGTGTVSSWVQGNNTLAGAVKFIDEGGNTSLVGVGACGSFPAIPAPGDEDALNTTNDLTNNLAFLNSSFDHKGECRIKNGELTFTALAPTTDVAALPIENLGGVAEIAVVPAGRREDPSQAVGILARLANMISPTAYAQEKKPNAPASGETIGPINIGTLPSGKSVTIVYSATINSGMTAPSVSDQGTVTATGGISVLTDDPLVGGAADPTVTLVEQPPTVAGITPSVNEDATLTFAATNFDAGFTDANAGDTLQILRITSLPANGLLKDNGATFTVPHDIPRANIGTLTYVPNTDYNGPDSFGWNGADATPAPPGQFALANALVNITVNSVNDVPSFTKGADQSVLEDAGAQTVAGWATNISKGPANESGQVVDFIVTNNNNSLFSAQPAVSATGDLTFTPAANANGTTIVSVKIHDNGGTAPGVDTSGIQTFNITVTAVNDPPSFTKGADQTVNEDSPAQTVSGWATSISRGPTDESAQVVNFIVSNDNNPLFSVQPAVSATGVLTYTPAANASGTAIVSVQIHDNGGGADTSAVQTFNITLTAVNDAPVLADKTPVLATELEDAAAPSGAVGTLVSTLVDFASPTGQVDNVTDADTGALLGVAITTASTTNGAWFYSIDNGGSWNPLTAVTNTSARLLAADANSRIYFQPNADFNGNVSPGITFRAWDQTTGTNGALGDTSTNGTSTAFSTATDTADLTITAVNDVPTLTAISDPASIPMNSGLQTVNLSGITEGPANESAQTVTVTAASDNTGLIPNPTVSYTDPATTGSLSYTPVAGQSGTAQITVTVKDNGGGADTFTRQFTVVVTGPLSGTKTVCASGCDYVNLTGPSPSGIFADINAAGLSGNLAININGDLTEPGTNGLNQWTETPAGSNYTVTIQPNAAATRTISGAVTNGMIRLNGADRVTIDGRFGGTGRFLTWRNTNTSNPTITLINDSSNNTIRSSIIEGSTTSVSNGVVFIGTGTTTGNDNNTFTDDQIRDRSDAAGVPARLFSSTGTSAGVSNSNNTISNSEVFNFSGFGVVIGSTGNDSWTISGNNIYETAPRTTSLSGINLACSGTNTISQNTIHDLTSTGVTVNAVQVSNSSGVTTVSRNRIYSFPSVSGATGTIAGIVSAADGTVTVINNQITLVPSVATNQLITGIISEVGPFNMYYNSVLVGGTASGATATYACKRQSDSTETWRNNICFNNRTGGSANHYAAGSLTSPTGTFSSDYNVFVGTGTTAANFFNSSNTAVPFATWKTNTGGDANSTAGNPDSTFSTSMFVNPAAGVGDLHINTGASSGTLALVSNVGTNVVGITNDYDNDTRDATMPDIGSDEFTAGPSADVSLDKALTTAGPFTAGQSIAYTIQVANGGPSTATNIQVTDTPSNLTITNVSGGGCAALPCTITSLASGSNTTIDVTATINAAGAFDNSATASAAESDPNSTNNTDNTGNGGTAVAAPVAAFIHDIQGSGSTSPIAGQSVVATGVVVGNFQGANKLQGFFLQEEDTDADADPLTSEGVFISCGACTTSVAEGQQVSATGVVSEVNGMTTVTASSSGSVVITNAGN
ncbi:MAG TPA: Ig-like domain-containing protein, partial [Pyrinomonadaceae bacterium]|nr:Ig-like domain-containing protein [Pyrinomonadaceae bacterium]